MRFHINWNKLPDDVEQEYQIFGTKPTMVKF